jgi:hypothetical protein
MMVAGPRGRCVRSPSERSPITRRSRRRIGGGHCRAPPVAASAGAIRRICGRGPVSRCLRVLATFGLVRLPGFWARSCLRRRLKRALGIAVVTHRTGSVPTASIRTSAGCRCHSSRLWSS